MDQIDCPTCGKVYRIDGTYAGRAFRCHCGHVVDVPGPDLAPPPPPPPAGYPGPPPVYADTGRATTAFVLGLLGIVLCSLCAPFAWSIGASERRRRMEVGLPPDGMATAGYVMGIIGTILLILGAVVMLVVALLAVGVFL